MSSTGPGSKNAEEQNTARALRINALEMLRQAGIVKDIDVVLPGAELDIEHPSLAGEVEIGVHLESMNDGITVRGEVAAPWSGSCRRCLSDLSGRAAVPVDELYQVEILDEDAYPIVDNQLDLGPMARQVVLLELDEERVCRADCAGLCPVCGIDRNAETCACDPTVKDDRWAALDGLVLDDG